jgi:hypothetical protein
MGLTHNAVQLADTENVAHRRADAGATIALGFRKPIVRERLREAAPALRSGRLQRAAAFNPPAAGGVRSALRPGPLLSGIRR